MSLPSLGVSARLALVLAMCAVPTLDAAPVQHPPEPKAPPPAAKPAHETKPAPAEAKPATLPSAPAVSTAKAAAPAATAAPATTEAVADRIMRRMSESVGQSASVRAPATGHGNVVAGGTHARASRVTLSWRTDLVWPTALTDDPAASALPVTRIALVWK